jgi:mycothiol synthase
VDHDLFWERPFVEADYAAQARLDALTDPGYSHAAEEIRAWDGISSGTPGHFQRKKVVEYRKTATVVAVGELSHGAFNFHPDKYWIDAVVDPEFQGRGLGLHLYALLEAEASQRRAICLWTNVRDDDPRSVRFFERLGFVPLRRTWRSRLDVTTANLTALPDRSRELAEQGIRLTSLGEEGRDRSDIRHRIYDLSRIASADVPRLGEYSPVSFEQFVQIDLEGPFAIPEAFFLAAYGGEYVGMTVLERESLRPDTYHVGFTGTHPRYRGRGIASQLKRRAVEYARDQGIRFLVTNNDSLNAPIWAINEKLGFRKTTTWLEGEKALTPHATPL